MKLEAVITDVHETCSYSVNNSTTLDRAVDFMEDLGWTVERVTPSGHDDMEWDVRFKRKVARRLIEWPAPGAIEEAGA